MKRDDPVAVTYTCGHVVLYRRPVPAHNARVLCLRCDVGVRVATNSAEYRVRCRDCRFSRRFGAAPHTAQQSATRHQIKTGFAHTVDTWHGDVLMETLAGVTIMELGDEPPF